MPKQPAEINSEYPCVKIGQLRDGTVIYQNTVTKRLSKPTQHFAYLIPLSEEEEKEYKEAKCCVQDLETM